jgi:hypothetical protein
VAALADPDPARGAPLEGAIITDPSATVRDVSARPLIGRYLKSR